MSGAGISASGRTELTRVLDRAGRFVTPTDVVNALGDRWPDEDRILDAALRGARAVSAAIPYIVHTAGR